MAPAVTLHPSRAGGLFVSGTTHRLVKLGQRIVPQKPESSPSSDDEGLVFEPEDYHLVSLTLAARSTATHWLSPQPVQAPAGPPKPSGRKPVRINVALNELVGAAMT